MEGGDGLLLLLLLALSALLHCMLGLLVKRIGWGWFSWHDASVQSNSLHGIKEKRTKGRVAKDQFLDHSLAFSHDAFGRGPFKCVPA